MKRIVLSLLLVGLIASLALAPHCSSLLTIASAPTRRPFMWNMFPLGDSAMPISESR